MIKLKLKLPLNKIKYLREGKQNSNNKSFCALILYLKRYNQW